MALKIRVSGKEMESAIPKKKATPNVWSGFAQSIFH
jgi:hypothetical protein